MSLFQDLNGNAPASAPRVLSANRFTLNATASSDLWRKPPSTDVDSAHMLVAPVRAETFRHMRVTVSGAFPREGDQGGLVLRFPGGGEWVKCGVERFEGSLFLCASAGIDTPRAADRSFVPLPDGGPVTVEFEQNPGCSTLWMSLVRGTTLVPLREVTWAFDKYAKGELQVGVYAARPTKSGQDGDELEVQFEGFRLGE